MRWALLALLLAACGGGGGSGSTEGSTTIPPSRPGLFYGYYGSCPTCLAGFQDHVNLLMTFPPWDGEQQSIDDMTRAALPTILGTPTDPVALQSLLTDLRNANVLRYVVALYPLDEPNLTGWTNATILPVLAQQRAVAAKFVELANVKLAVIYGPGSTLPGIGPGGYDWVGFDDYNAGDYAADGELDIFESQLLPTQRVMMVPGGADPWHTDPRPFYIRAQSDPQVLVILPFLWRDYSQGRGIGNNGQAPVYRPYGLAISHPPS